MHTRKWLISGFGFITAFPAAKLAFNLDSALSKRCLPIGRGISSDGMQLRDGLQVIGPAFLVSVAYLDPGNWATAIESGARFGYDQLWILVLSNVIAIHLQALSSRLGLASGKHLAQVCRDSYPPAVCHFLWLMAEASIVALDLTMVLGTAIGLNLLFKIPPVSCILLTALDALALFLLFPQTALRQAEQWTAVLVFSVLACFVIDLFISKPPLRSVLSGLYPTLHRDDIYSAVSLLGANVMPHNFYLHSALVAGQSSRNDTVTARRCYLNSLDIACALGLALMVNVAVLLVAASTFHSAGVQVATLQEAHDLLEQILNSRTAPLAFGLALLLTGQMSTFTSTIAGQVVMSGFVGLTTSTLGRRLTTRALAIAPALFVQLVYGAEGTYRMLVIAQVVLAMQLPFTLIPLIKSTSSRAIMGVFASSRLRSSIAWAASFVVFVANMLMLVDMLWMETPEQIAARQEEQGFADKGFDEWLAQVVDVMTRSPRLFLGTCAVTCAAMMAMALLMWMSVHPVCVHGSLRAGKVTSSIDLQDDGSDPERGLDDADLDTDDGFLARGQGISDSSPPTVSFVNLMFADLPIRHVRRLWAALRAGLFTARTVCPPLTQEVLDQHLLSTVTTERHFHYGLQQSQPSVDRPLLDWRSQKQRRLRWQRACEDMQRIAPSECSLSTLDGMQSLQSIQTAASATSEPGGGKGHRMGRGSRRKFANLMCAIWGQHWDTHGQPIRGTVVGCVSATIDTLDPLLFGCTRKMVVELCDAVVEAMQVPGVDSILQLGMSPTSLGGASSNMQEGSQKPGIGSVRADKIAALGTRLASCAAMTQALHDSAAPIREAAALAGTDAEIHRTPGACFGSWGSVVKAVAEVFPHVAERVIDGWCDRTQKNSNPADGEQPSTGQAAVLMGLSRDERLTSQQSTFMSDWGATVGAQCSESSSQGTEVMRHSTGMFVPRLCFVGFCLWCMAALLQLASVEPRPELWGRYVAALNHLQGPLFITLNLAAALQGSAWLPAGRSGPWRAAGLSDYGLDGISRSAQFKVLQSLEGIHAELRQLLHEVEAHIDSCGASHDSDRTAVAFAKGKFNIVSLIKRLRAHLARRECGTAAPQAGAASRGRISSSVDAWQPRGTPPWRSRSVYSRAVEQHDRSANRSATSVGSWRLAAQPGAHDRTAGQ